MTVTVDNYTRILLTVIAVLLSLITVALWVDSPLKTPAAQAAIPDSGEQLNALIENVKAINQSFDKISKLLLSGEVRVQVLPPVEKKSSAGTPQSIPSTPATPPAAPAPSGGK